ncbi:Ubiquitin-conjugating enzyme subunit [Lodderomyces elongisporus]|uniref:Ubiquitin-conjugating enzyme subunit n=1 Tax=Lodderomyces elongisporus TaxID=36914 RepID=UPI00292721AA|nr:Ubiquitin-conjugating enzyme subunit [Lodderomyces elongisporus]WLF81478.1 Ubiquitin-conjugating enzyme subunit [Lodderomyces elongisporus]
MSSKSAAAILQRQFKDLTDPKKRIPSFHIELDDDNIFLWNIGVMVLNPDSLYHGGYFKGQMRFPQDFPFSPPSFRFTPAIYHPNIYRDGRLCISILHQGGDPTSDEPESETWSPAQTVESVLISIISLLDDPNGNSPANIDASVEFRKNPEEYKKKVLKEVERSKKDIPEDFVMPDDQVNAYDNQMNRRGVEGLIDEPVDEDFWYDSEEEDEDEESFDEESLMDHEEDVGEEEEDEEEEVDEDIK